MMLMMLAKMKLCSMIHPLFPRFLSSASAILKTPKFIAADYLVASFGFSPDKAATLSKPISHLKSSEKPDSVRRFLKDNDFSVADINKLITRRPILLCSSPEKTLDPNLRALRHMGLSTSALNQIILSNPNALLLQSAVPRIAFWMDFLGQDEATLVKAFVCNRELVTHHISLNIAPKISLLQTQGFSTLEIVRIVCSVPRFITSRISGMEGLLNRTKELGFQPGSGMFLQGLHAMLNVTREVLQKRMDLLKSFGWSEDDFFSAVRNAPLMMALKEETLRVKMDFLLGEARCDLSYIVSHPLLLSFSLERRLRPRNNVLHILESRDLSVKERSFLSAMQYTDSQFVDKCILPYKEEIKDLHETYLASCASEARKGQVE